MPLQIIGAGLGRTGTHSLKLALQQLGFGPCYHMEDLLTHDTASIQHWENAKAGKAVNWNKLFEKYQSAVDIPTFIYYRELLQHFPEARVILTVRNAESWYQSFGSTIIPQSKPTLSQILSMSFKMPFSRKTREQLRVFKFAGAYLKEFLPAGFENKEKTLEVFHGWNQQVKDSVPGTKLLVYDVKEGWEPLCRFLNVPVPAMPFPHSNTTAEFNSRKV